MRKVIQAVVVLIAGVCVVVTGYAAKGWLDASRAAGSLSRRADALIAAGRGGGSLGEQRLAWLLKVEDPAFYQHTGYDLSTAGAGATTLTQSLSKRIAFDEFKPGIGKPRQTAYAVSLERHLSKEQILALFLDTVPLGRGRKGRLVGLYAASEALHGRSPRELTDEQFLTLVAVMIAPFRLSAQSPSAEVTERVARIGRLLAGQCAPAGHGDVWLEGCTS